MTGELGEGTGIRDELNEELTKSDELLEEAIPESGIKKEPLILIGGRSQVRCHSCSTAKNQEDKGMFIQINKFIAWFHSVDCHAQWIKANGTNFKTGAVIDEYGQEI